MVPHIAQVLIPGALSFAVGILCTPLLTRLLYKHKLWKKRPGKMSLDGGVASEFNRLHSGHEIRAPRLGGVVIWMSVLITIAGTSILAHLTSSNLLAALDFFTRSQTWLPLGALLVGAVTGMVDDLLVVGTSGEGLRLRYRILIVLALSAFIGWWFWGKLGVATVGIPFAAPLTVGVLIIPLFVFVSLALYASGVIDGIDGLSGGVFGSIFASYAIIAYAQGEFQLAAFCASVLGGILAFLWFNIPPARFYMSDTGTMALTLSLGVVAFMTDDFSHGVGVGVLPVVGALLVVTVLSDVAQVLSKRFFGRKLLRIAPLHHHFEALGWPGSKVVMRYWVLSVFFAFAGVIIALAQHP